MIKMLQNKQQCYDQLMTTAWVFHWGSCLFPPVWDKCRFISCCLRWSCRKEKLCKTMHWMKSSLSSSSNRVPISLSGGTCGVNTCSYKGPAQCHVGSVPYPEMAGLDWSWTTSSWAHGPPGIIVSKFNHLHLLRLTSKVQSYYKDWSFSLCSLPQSSELQA